MSKGWSLPICLIALLSTNGWVWGQADYILKEEQQKPFLQPYSPETNNQNQNLDVSHKNISNNTGKHKNVSKTLNKVSVSTKTSSKSPLGQRKRSEIQNAGQEIDTAKSSLGFQGYNHSNSHGSGSFLDGYLLKSLQEKKIERKNVVNDNISDRNLQKKTKD
jgi:hypothetical protein